MGQKQCCCTKVVVHEENSIMINPMEPESNVAEFAELFLEQTHAPIF